MPQITQMKTKEHKIFLFIKSIISDCICSVVVTYGKKIPPEKLNEVSNKVADRIIAEIKEYEKQIEWTNTKQKSCYGCEFVGCSSGSSPLQHNCRLWNQIIPEEKFAQRGKLSICEEKEVVIKSVKSMAKIK